MAYLVGDILEVVSACRSPIQNGLNVRHYRCLSVVGTGSTDAQIASAFDALFKPVYLPCLAPVAQWYGTSIQKILPAPKGTKVSAVTGPTVGTATGDALPTQVCGLISVQTALAGRSYRGRKYIPFPSETFNSPAGDPTAPYLTLLNAICVAEVSQVVSGTGGNTYTWKPVIWGGHIGAITDVNNAFYRTGWGTQRRRGDIRRPDTVPF